MDESKFKNNIALVEASQGGDEEATEKLILSNMGLVNSIAAKFIGRGTELEDLKELGILGLVKAIRSFDTSRGCAFSTYAVPLILGEIRRFLRDDGIIKISRSQKRLCAALLAEREKCLTEGMTSISIAELARRCNTTPEEAAMALESATPISSFSDMTSSDCDGMTVESTLFDEEQTERDFNKIAISLAIEKLPEMQKKIILLRYFRNYSQQQTARSLGLTQVKISREEKKILSFLQKELS